MLSIIKGSIDSNMTEALVSYVLSIIKGSIDHVKWYKHLSL